MTKSVDDNSVTTTKPFIIMSEVRLIRESIAAVIERYFGYNSILCENLERGLSAIPGNPGATVLFDSLFPRGPDAVREIRTRDPAREHEIIQMIGEGMSNKEISRELNIELSTTKTHVHNLLVKLGLQRRGQVAYWAYNNVAERKKAISG
jgi:DNA-binding CsgD family transcriptional regulator